ncbi:hypothetical protein [Paenibacillus mucilaginosus]|uniref:hypothetical protein n=1 Tax=Paenibacillus mucilaginosus TaxID=61624 RepID=UPI0002EAF8E1|nr:hypothetical protein [Paenibacillus mucilaginosus]
MPQLIVKPLPVKREGCSSPGAAYRVHSSSCTGCSVVSDVSGSGRVLNPAPADQEWTAP